MKSLIESIRAKFGEFIKDANLQQDKCNKAAGLRARKTALTLMADLKEFRKRSMEASKD